MTTSQRHISINGARYAALKARCDELGLTIADVVEHLVDDALPRPASKHPPRVAIEVSDDLFASLEITRYRSAVVGVRPWRGDVLEAAIERALSEGMPGQRREAR